MREFCMTKTEGWSNEPTWLVNLTINNNSRFSEFKYNLLKFLETHEIPLVGDRVKEFWVRLFELPLIRYETNKVLDEMNIHRDDLPTLNRLVSWDEIALDWLTE